MKVTPVFAWYDLWVGAYYVRDNLDPAQRRLWHYVERACDWVDQMQIYRLRHEDKIPADPPRAAPGRRPA